MLAARVALRKESVDRNCYYRDDVPDQRVALRKESVDRNFYFSDKDADWVRSLSARRAWIEIRRFLASLSAVLTSLSARRAWIEISYTC